MSSGAVAPTPLREVDDRPGVRLTVARRVADDQKQPGDLIFTYRGGRIGHVGIYAGFAGRAYTVGRVS